MSLENPNQNHYPSTIQDSKKKLKSIFPMAQLSQHYLLFLQNQCFIYKVFIQPESH